MTRSDCTPTPRIFSQSSAFCPLVAARSRQQPWVSNCPACPLVPLGPECPRGSGLEIAHPLCMPVDPPHTISGKPRNSRANAGRYPSKPSTKPATISSAPTAEAALPSGDMPEAVAVYGDRVCAGAPLRLGTRSSEEIVVAMPPLTARSVPRSRTARPTGLAQACGARKTGCALGFCR